MIYVDDYIWKKIPYKKEIISICQNIHSKSLHAEIRKCQDLLFKSDYFWEGYSKVMKKIIEECPTCNKIKRNQVEKRPNAIILDDRPHYR